MIQILKFAELTRALLKRLWCGIVEWFLGPVPQHKWEYHDGRSILEV